MDKVLSSPQTLAFLGDAYFGLLVRSRLALVERPVGELHAMSVKLVNATAQAKGAVAIMDMLTEHELSVFKRGRNAHQKHTPKNSSVAEYHAATGLEALFGYLKLANNTERAEQLFDVIWSTVYNDA